MVLIGAKNTGHQTKQMFVYQTIRDAIMRCEFKPNQRLVASAIARHLSVSPIPVREALQLLQAEGLVENIAHTGASVAPISHESIVETFTVLEGLEIVATRTAAGRMMEEDRTLLTSILEQMDDVLRTGVHDRWGDLNAQFHLTIAGITGMPMLHDMTERALGQWDRIRRYYFTDVLEQRIVRSQHEHHAILEAMQHRDMPTLEWLVRAHNQGALAAYMEYLLSQPAPADAGTGRANGTGEDTREGRDASMEKRFRQGSPTL